MPPLTSETLGQQNQKRPFLRKAFAALSAAGIFATASGQDSDANEDENVFELSPFTVEASSNEGYRASSTLAGTRLNTKLKDVASSISVVTKDFLDDTQSTDLKQLLVHTASTEVAGPMGNFSDDAGRNNEREFTERPIEINATTRVRGLAGATITRDYFESLIPMDSYNTDSVTVNRGANSILFGVGSPAGIINTGLISPIFEDRDSVSLSYGSYGSLRSSLDVSRLINEKLAVRFAALYEDTKYQQKPAFERDERIFATLAYRPTEDLTFKLNVESGEIDANQPRQFAPVDSLTMWWDPLAHPEGLVKPVHDAIATPALSPYGAYFGPLGPIVGSPVVWSVAGSGEVDASRNPSNAEAFLIFRHPNFTPSDSSDRELRAFATLRGTGQNQRYYNNGQNEAIANQFANRAVTDESILDFRNNLLDGDNKGSSMDFDSISLTAEQLFLDKQAGIEFAFDSQSVDLASHSLFGGARSYNLQIDVNTVLPDGNPNPNFGRPMISWAGGDWDEATTESDTYRATGFFNLKATDKFEGLLGKIIGDHTVTALFEKREEKNESLGGLQYAWGDDYVEFNRKPDGGLTLGGIGNVGNRTFRSLGGIVYLGDSLKDAASPSNADLIERLPLLNVGNSRSMRTYSYNDDAWVTREFGVIQNPITNAGLNRLERTSKAIIFNSRFLDDHLVATYGWRDDEVKSFALDGVPRGADGAVLLDDPSFVASPSGDPYQDTTFSWGVVAHMPQSIVENLGPINRLSLHYAEAENRVASNRVRHDFFDRALSAPLGETKEYGVSVALFDDNISIRANVYETVQSLRSDSSLNGLTGIIGQEVRFINQIEEVIAVNPGNQADIELLRNYPDFPQVIKDGWNITTDTNGLLQFDAPDNLSVTSDGVSKGFELEMVGNLTSNWTISMNAAKQEVTRNNSAPAVTEYLYGEFNRAAVWEESAFGRFKFNPSNETTIEDQMDTYISSLQLAQLQDGSTSIDQVREWRFNVFTNYRFADDSSLKGWTVGGGARWQDDVAIGFPQIFDTELGEYRPDVTSPYFGPDQLKIDAFVRYKRKLFEDRVDWTLQLNINNALNEDDLVPVVANPDGSFPVYSIPAERTFTLRSTFEF
ncbi:TonB-dependent receptor plug domain-containing protein [Pelagicoccus sp. NFK12]|uniref:TonB-dependent receptor plug domain-containing protein n=1 Tax=Pelagicoccus enzymogenes TaxID=2773457 RepID=A0A927FA82_9BACT|nr:TonB-dependent receptor plug domain-containing protein [Pelagicoccus enzymogenes]MBD5780066.1 TonB-dependent receptor plug domain-containing protein [Pelagicoccus enzymogenes]